MPYLSLQGSERRPPKGKKERKAKNFGRNETWYRGTGVRKPAPFVVAQLIITSPALYGSCLWVTRRRSTTPTVWEVEDTQSDSINWTSPAHLYGTKERYRISRSRVGCMASPNVGQSPRRSHRYIATHPSCWADFPVAWKQMEGCEHMLLRRGMTIRKTQPNDTS